MPHLLLHNRSFVYLLYPLSSSIPHYEHKIGKRHSIVTDGNSSAGHVPVQWNPTMGCDRIVLIMIVFLNGEKRSAQ